MRDLHGTRGAHPPARQQKTATEPPMSNNKDEALEARRRRDEKYCLDFFGCSPCSILTEEGEALRQTPDLPRGGFWACPTKVQTPWQWHTQRIAVQALKLTWAALRRQTAAARGALSQRGGN